MDACYGCVSEAWLLQRAAYLGSQATLRAKTTPLCLTLTGMWKTLSYNAFGIWKTCVYTQFV